MPRVLLILLLLSVPPLRAVPVVTEDHAPIDVARVLEAIRESPFDEPIHLESEDQGQEVHGRVHAILDVPLAELRDAVTSPQGWCEILFLHYNIKSCVHEIRDDGARLTVSIGRKYYQDPEVAKATLLRFHIDEQGDDQFAVRLQADRGPLGIRAFQIRVQAVSLDEQRSLMRLGYSLGYGTLARLAMRVYFSTGGRNRIGFTMQAAGEGGEPRPVGGVRGMIERNTMRFFYALTTYLRVPGPEHRHARHILWFDQTEQYPAQLREMDQATYLEQKRRERRNQDVLQATAEGQ